MPTSRRPVHAEEERWSGLYAGQQYYYGQDPGPVARRTVRYDRVWRPRGGTALDVGCGEGQDLKFLAEMGYEVTGLELTEAGAAKSRALLAECGVEGSVIQADAADSPIAGSFDLVLAVNSLQFMGRSGPECLLKLLAAVRPGGVIGLSLFAREGANPEFTGTLWLTTFEDTLAALQGWQMLEAARLWQWDTSTNRPQAFITAIARKWPPANALINPIARG